MTLGQFHGALVCAWLGVVAAETVIERQARDVASTKLVATMHRWIDMVIEVPIAVLVGMTGIVLLARAWPAPPLLIAKAAAGMVPVLINIYCFIPVLERARTTDAGEARALTRRIFLSAAWGLPFGIFALVVGFKYFSPG